MALVEEAVLVDEELDVDVVVDVDLTGIRTIMKLHLAVTTDTLDGTDPKMEEMQRSSLKDAVVMVVHLVEVIEVVAVGVTVTAMLPMGNALGGYLNAVVGLGVG